MLRELRRKKKTKAWRRRKVGYWRRKKRERINPPYKPLDLNSMIRTPRELKRNIHKSRKKE